MIKEYIQLLILDFLSTSPYLRKLCFIGGTHLRLIMGIDRFSEDIDFDCKELTLDEFNRMTEEIKNYLQHNGFRVEAKEQESNKLQAFRRSLYFPELLFELGLSAHREERFLIKIEAQDQKIDYRSNFVFVKGCGLFFPFPVPSKSVMCAMKIAAMLNRQKGRDFYDTMFLLSFTQPDYSFLKAICGIGDLAQLKTKTKEVLAKIDLNSKRKDFEHLLFSQNNSRKLIHFEQFIDEL
ncbi:MAG TPA: nucleotidyl transferase AbiEii/AbiGii toxin family protein [Candidatus Cloacimonadota bacterium]|nr:nucleotidyl transferase AbiEii/AbiGii toxin family protein [Candidatus Cloacimonadota bacterium]